MNKMKVRKKWILRILSLLVVAGLVTGGLIYARGRASTGTVSVYPVSSLGYTEYGENRSMYGEVTDAAMQEVRLGESLVEKICVKAGQEVKKGDTLMQYNKESVKLIIKSDKAAIALLEAEMESAKEEMLRLQTLHSSEEMPQGYEQVIRHRVDPVSTLDVVDVGTAPSEEGNVYYCSLTTRVTKELLQSLDDSDQTAVFRMYENDVEIGSWEVDGKKMTSGTKIIYILPDPTPAPVPTPVPTPEPAQDPESGAPEDADQDAYQDATRDATRDAGQDASRNAARDLIQSPSQDLTQKPDKGSYREEQGPYEDWILGEALEFNGDGTVTVDYSTHQYGTLRSVMPGEAEWEEIIYVDPQVNTDNGNYSYSRKELAEMIKEKEDSLKAKDLDLKAAKLKLETDELISTDGKVKASMDGVVTELKDPSEVKQGEALITVKGNNGFTITVHVSEYDIASFSIGERLSVMSYETSSFLEAEVTEVLLDPESQGGYGFYGPNVTSYPVIATVMDTEVELHRGEGCEVTRSEMEEAGGGSLVIPAMMVRKDLAGSYCMVADEDNRLKRVPVTTGRLIWGSEIVILDGITEGDRIAFPYGKYVKEGSPVVDKDNIYEDF